MSVHVYMKEELFVFSSCRYGSFKCWHGEASRNNLKIGMVWIIGASSLVWRLEQYISHVPFQWNRIKTERLKKERIKSSIKWTHLQTSVNRNMKQIIVMTATICSATVFMCSEKNITKQKVKLGQCSSLQSHHYILCVTYHDQSKSLSS